MILKFDIAGQVKSGKNNMNITRSGHRYPNPKWAEWRDNVVEALVVQTWPMKFAFPIVIPCAVFIFAYHGDLRRRDAPGMLDALFHCFEKAGIVKDDSLLAEAHWFPLGIDRLYPRASIIIETKEA